SDVAGQPVLDIRPQRRVGQEFGRLRSPRRAIRVPLRGHGQIFETAATSCSIAPQFARNRRSRSSKLPSDFANAFTMSVPAQHALVQQTTDTVPSVPLSTAQDDATRAVALATASSRASRD